MPQIGYIIENRTTEPNRLTKGRIELGHGKNSYRTQARKRKACASDCSAGRCELVGRCEESNRRFDTPDESERKARQGSHSGRQGVTRREFTLLRRRRITCTELVARGDPGDTASHARVMHGCVLRQQSFFSPNTTDFKKFQHRLIHRLWFSRPAPSATTPSTMILPRKTFSH